MEGRAPLASDPSTTEDSRRTAGRASSAGPSLVNILEAVVLEGAKAINARRDRAALPRPTQALRPSNSATRAPSKSVLTLKVWWRTVRPRHGAAS